MSRLFWRSLLLTVCLAAAATVPGAGWVQDSRPSPATASAPIHEPLDLVPAESLLCWYGRRFPDVSPPSDDPSTVNTLWQLGLRFTGTVLNKEAQLWARVAEGFNLMIRYPHAVVLIDAQAQPVESDPNARRADRLRCALIVQSGRQEEHFVRVIQAAINEQTDSEKATLSRRQAVRWPYQELSDQRLPDWCTLAWGRIDDYFVLTLGPDVWPLIASVAAGEAPALSRADWLAPIRGQRGHEALIEIVVAIKAIQQRLDPFVDGRASDFFRAWHCDEVDRAYWALGFEGPAMYCVAHFFEGGQMLKRVYADPAIRDAKLLATIPDTARYAIYRVPPATVIPRFLSSLLATRDVQVRRDTEELWARIQAEHGFDAKNDILAHLGDHIVMHNDPPHPAHVPLAMTTLTEIRSEPEKVRATIEKIGQAWLEMQDRRFQETGQYNALRIAREKPDIWYLHFGPDVIGLVGPAWTVTDRFIITSWSPTALRSYLDKVGDRAGQRSPVKVKDRTR